MRDNTAVKLENVNKTFRVAHEKRETFKSHFLNPFRRIRKDIFYALKDVSLEINKGEFVGIIGRNGSGKSTLLKIIAGIYAPDKGKVRIEGKLVPFLELGVGFNPELSGRENIFLNGTILGMKGKFLEENFEKIVEFAELKEFIEVPLKNYSSGMQVRLAFAIAIQTDADIYLLDEILSVGDAAFREKSLTAMKDLKKAGKTILYVSHDLDSVEEHCDKVLLVDHGEKVAFGEPDETVLKYSSLVMRGQNLSEGGKEKKDISIGDLELFSNGAKSSSFVIKHGDDIELHLNIQATKELPEGMKAGLGIYTVSGDYLFGVNTGMDDYAIKSKTKKIILKIPKLKLLDGKYFVNVVLYESEETLPVDFAGRALYFKVTNSPKYRGAVSLEHYWDTK